MKQPTNHITLTLMISSMVLLVTLQGLWLRNSYDNAYADFQEETSRLFRTAVLAVRDSSLLENIEALPPDSLGLREFTFTSRFDTTIALRRGNHRRLSHTDGQVQVYISPGATFDSSKVMLRSIASQFHEGKLKGNSRFLIRMRTDSLSTDSISAQFGRSLAKADKRVPFEIKKITQGPPFSRMTLPRSGEHLVLGNELDHGHDHDPFLDNTLQSEWVRVDPAIRYAAVLTDIRPMLLGKITPQILFACFLTALTFVSFAFMYRSIRSQQRLMAIKNDFISNITHELKTPIATVSVALEALKNFKGIDNPKLTSEYLDIAQHELGRLSMLTDKVLTTSLFDERGVTLEFEPVDLAKTTTTILSAMKLVVEKLDATISFEKTGTDFVAEGSALHLTNVLYNLLDNALKYSLERPQITILLQDLEEKVVISVTDKGIGIPSDYQNKIFEKFFRMPTGDVHNIKGYGLGLSYVQQVIKGHGGTISVKSVPGEGSAFTITLPKLQK